LFFIPPVAIAQWVSDIRTEYYFRNGVIDYNSYQLLRELAEGAEIRDTTDFIISTLGISPVEIIEKLDNTGDRQQQTIASSSRKSVPPWSGRLRMGSDIRADGNESFALGAIRSGDFAAELKIRDENGSRITERRNVKFRRNKYSLIVGNFTADIGCGLSMGRFDYRPLSLETYESDINEFLFPDNSYYNGLKAEFLDRYTFIYSGKKYNDMYKNTFGTALEADVGSIRVGIVGAMARLSEGSAVQTLGSGSVFMKSGPSGLEGEIAFAGSGSGVSVQAVRPGLVLRGWYYHDSYINLQSSGFSHPDYQSYTVLDSEISFRQPQRGESGFYAHKRVTYKRFRFGNAAEFWKNPRNRKIRYNNSLLAKYHAMPSVISRLCFTVYYKNDIYYNRLEAGIGIFKDYKVEARAYINLSKNIVAKSESKLYITAILPLVESMSLAGRLRWRFDGLFDYYLEERLLLNDGLFLKATYRWNENQGRELGALYIFLENRF
jgi:hypothetical protein